MNLDNNNTKITMTYEDFIRQEEKAKELFEEKILKKLPELDHYYIGALRYIEPVCDLAGGEEKVEGILKFSIVIEYPVYQKVDVPAHLSEIDKNQLIGILIKSQMMVTDKLLTRLNRYAVKSFYSEVDDPVLNIDYELTDTDVKNFI